MRSGPTTTTPPAEASSVNRLALGTTLAVVMAAGPLAVLAISALGPQITADLGLSHAEFGLLATLAFAAAVPCAVLLGRSVDRYPARAILVGVFAASGLSVAVTAYAPSFGWLVAGVLLSGLAMSVTNPVTNHVVSRHVAPGQRGSIMGAKQSGVQISQLLAGLVLPGLAAAVGWHGAIVAMLAIVLVGLVLSHLFIPAHEPIHHERRGSAPPAKLPSDVWFLLFYSLLSGAALQATLTYLPLFGYERISLSNAAAGLTVAVVGAIGLVARMGWGWAADRSRGHRRILAPMAISGAAAACLLAAASATESAWLLWIAAALSGATTVASNVVVMTTLVRVVDTRLIGRATGRLAIGLYGGFAIGPVSFGILVETAGYTAAWLVLAAVYFVAALLVAGSRPSADVLPHAAPDLQEQDGIVPG
ncbi:MAG: hypothetical protein QOE19_2434 [Actinomycetota bacterium]|nr:hypothetical protein [Actinomycetota bacterium]MDQ1669343.1 hypothetical protein [Actinomycetota bacterium]